LKERTMVNSRRRVQLFGFPVELPGEQEVPGFHVWPPEEEVPGFRMNSDGSVRLPTERKSSVTDYAWPSVMAELTQPPLQPKVGPPPGIKMEVAPEPPPQPPAWLGKNTLGIPYELLKDPALQPFYMDAPGRVLPRPRPWPWQRPDERYWIQL